jgi:ATP-dependent DNA ligase
MAKSSKRRLELGWFSPRGLNRASGLPSRTRSAGDLRLSSRHVAQEYSGFVEPCRSSKATRAAFRSEWVHAVKFDGFRLLVRRDGSRVRCFTRAGYDWADRFPAIVEAARALKAQSFLIDGEAIVCRPDGLSDFDALRYRGGDQDATLVAFDLTELQAEDQRELPLEHRKQRPAKLLGRGSDAITYNEHLSHMGREREEDWSKSPR